MEVMGTKISCLATLGATLSLPVALELPAATARRASQLLPPPLPSNSELCRPVEGTTPVTLPYR